MKGDLEVDGLGFGDDFGGVGDDVFVVYGFLYGCEDFGMQYVVGVDEVEDFCLGDGGFGVVYGCNVVLVF